MRKRSGKPPRIHTTRSKQKHGEQAMQGLKTATQLRQVAMYLRQPQTTACKTNRNLGKIIPK